jgi:hypothetical protein
MNADPLAALRPLHAPDPVSWWPPAPGWWLSALLLLLFVCGMTLLIRRTLQRNRYRRAAAAELAQLLAATRDGLEPRVFAAAASALLRRAALAHYPRHEVAHLTGAAWLAFLDRSGATGEFSNGPGRALQDAAYDPSAPCDVDALQRLCHDWLRRHR